MAELCGAKVSGFFFGVPHSKSMGFLGVVFCELRRNGNADRKEK